MTQETKQILTEQEVLDVLEDFDRVLSAYLFHLEAIYHSEDDEEIIVCWECIQKICNIHGGHDTLHEYLNEGQGRYGIVKQKLRRLMLI